MYKPIPPNLTPTSSTTTTSGHQNPVLNLDHKVQPNISTKFLSLIPTAKAPRSQFSDLEHSKHILHHEMYHVLQNKNALLRFCNMFANVKEEEKQKVSYIINYLQTQLSENPLDFNRALQACIETSLKKIRFSELELQAKFPAIQLLDVTGKNDGITDSSTLFSLFQTEYLRQNPGFTSNVETSVVISTCIKSDNLKDIDLKLFERFALSKKNTGNTLNDVDLDGVHYDYKFSPEILYAKNHIYFYSADSTKFKEYFFQIQVNYKRDMDKSITMSEDERRYLRYLTFNLQQLWNNRNLTMVEKTLKWNEFIYKTLASRPNRINIPILIPTSHKPFSMDKAKIEELNEVGLPNTKKLEPQVVLTTVKSILDKYDTNTNNNAYTMTKGVLGKPKEFSNIESDKDS